MRLLGLSDEEVIGRLGKEAQSRKRAWRRQRQFFELSDSIYYFERYGLKDPGSIEGADGVEVQTNDGTNVVDLTVGLLGETEIDIHAVPIVSEEESMRKTSELEAWLWGVLDVNSEDQGKEPHMDALNDATRLGMGVLYTYFDSGRDCPFVIKSLDPYTVYPEEGITPRGQWRSVLVIEKKPVTQLEEEWGQRIPEQVGSPYESRERIMLDEIDYWGYEFIDEELAEELSPEVAPQEEPEEMGEPPSPEEGIGGLAGIIRRLAGQQPQPLMEQPSAAPEARAIEPGWYVVNCILAGKHMVRPPTIMPGYTEVPFTIFGCKQGAGRAKGEKRPEYYFLSALFPIHKAILLLDANMSAQQRQVAAYVNLPMAHWAGRMGRTNLQFDAKLGNILQFEYPDEKIGFPQWPGNPPDVFATQAFHKRQIQEGSFSSVAMGEQVQLSGFAMSQLWQANLVRLSQPRRSWSYALKDVLRKVQSYAVNLAPSQAIPLLCNYKTILNRLVQMTGAELGQYIVDVELSTDLPQDQFRRWQIGIALAQLGPMSPFSQRTLGEKLFDIQQPEEEEKLKVQEQVRAHWLVQAFLVKQAIESQFGIYVPIELLLEQKTAEPFMQMLRGMAPMGMPGGEQAPTAPGAGMIPQGGPGMMPQGPPGMMPQGAPQGGQGGYGQPGTIPPGAPPGIR